jgi:ATP-binding cassette subfamily F protein 3
LEEYLRNSRETQLIISHDRAFLARVADHVLHLEDGSAQAYSGGYAAFFEQRAERRLSVQREFDKQRKSIAREEDYIRRNIAGQNSKQAKGRRKRLAWLPRLSAPSGDASTMAVRFTPGARGGDQVLVSDRAKIAIGERVLLKPFSGFIRRGDVVGLLGPNGTGKSTLLKAILGEKSLAAGELRVGGAITIGSYRQDFANVPRDFALYDIIAGLRPMWERGMVMGHLGRVQFSGDEVRRSASSLSGGELARVALAMMMLEGANFLIFDEPTNHLDVESIEALEDAILEFEGTVLLVSHDRELLRKLVTRVWELRDGQLNVFDGPFDEWEERRDDATAQAEALAADQAAADREKNRRKATARSAVVQKDTLSTKERQRLVDKAERRVEALESATQQLSEQLEDPSLYGTPDGVARAHELSRLLELQRAELARAVEEWDAAMQLTESP